MNNIHRNRSIPSTRTDPGVSVIKTLVFLSLTALLPSPVTADGDVARGEVLYRVCQTCHGENGEGSVATGAPRLAGQHNWYLINQLEKFRLKIRGAHMEDTRGQQMAAMAMTLPDVSALQDVVAYIDTLTATPASPTESGGNAQRGQELYTSCMQCHGTKGQGLRKLPEDWETQYDSPRLSGQHDWYLVRQLENFKAGVRGSHQADKEGLAMRAQVNTLFNRQMILDVVAYIKTL